jgi:hypothetical protein
MLRVPERVRWVLAATVLVLIGWGPVRAQAGPLTVEVTQSTLSVNADDVPLAEVLLAIGQRAKARILIESILEDQVGKERVTTSFADLTMDDGLRRILKNRNFILGFGPGGVDEIRVYVDGGTGFRDLTAPPREAMGPTGPSRPTGSMRRRGAREAPVEDRARLAQLRQVTLTSTDATARLEALEELSETQDTAYLLDTVVEALGRERDAKVLEGLLDVVQDRGPISVAPLRALVTSDRDGAARAQALEILADYAGSDPSTRTLLQTLSRSDPSERVRDIAQTLLESLETPPAPRPPQPPARREGAGR